MATVFPTLPTDNLYKFFALFGLVILVFGVAFPGEKLRQSLVKIDEADKARQIAKIRLNRRSAQVRETLEQFKAKSAEYHNNEKLLMDTTTILWPKKHSNRI
jgi:hypothetical protein